MDVEDEEKLLEYVFRAMKALEGIDRSLRVFLDEVEAKPSLPSPEEDVEGKAYKVAELAPGFVRAPVKFDEDIEEQYYRLSKTV